MKIFQRNKNLSWNTFKGNIIILDSSSNNAIHELDEIGSWIWSKLEKFQYVEELAMALCKEFDVEFQEASNDVTFFLNELEDKGLIL